MRMLELSPKIEKQWNSYIRKLARSEPQKWMMAWFSNTNRDCKLELALQYVYWLMFIHEQSRIEAYGAARNESMKMHVKATNCIVVYNNATTENFSQPHTSLNNHFCSRVQINVWRGKICSVAKFLLCGNSTAEWTVWDICKFVRCLLSNWRNMMHENMYHSVWYL
jgi:hypothetical protein